ncbi:hypothetical protein HWV62_19743 [Athelia sp. TMB]|nr:hypothetical protein HWV62_43674 [Athelia sp. TMB]KAF7971868.1 hypothetical protein HWV62_19743 [Athelia sp. TMB]
MSSLILSPILPEVTPIGDLLQFALPVSPPRREDAGTLNVKTSQEQDENAQKGNHEDAQLRSAVTTIEFDHNQGRDSRASSSTPNSRSDALRDLGNSSPSTFQGRRRGEGRRSSSASRRDREREAYTPSNAKHAVLAEEERQGSHLKAVLRTTGDRLEHEIRRADRAEQRLDLAETRARELCTKLGAAEAARHTAELEAIRFRDEMKRFQMQVEVFERNLKRAQEDVEKLEKRRIEAEDNASKSRDAARKLQTAISDYQARDEGREEARRKEIQKWYDVGRQEGWDAGQEDGFKEGKKEGFREGKSVGYDEGKKSGREKGLAEGKERGRKEERQYAMKAFEKLLAEEEKQDRRGYEQNNKSDTTSIRRWADSAYFDDASEFESRESSDSRESRPQQAHSRDSPNSFEVI